MFTLRNTVTYVSSIYVPSDVGNANIGAVIKLSFNDWKATSHELSHLNGVFF